MKNGARVVRTGRDMGRSGGLSICLALCTLAMLLGAEPERTLPEPSFDRLPRWRGFNLTEKFHLRGRNGPFVEDDFRWIRQWGFNFVRLPMDYRTWIEDGDWTRFNEKTLRDIDQAVAWGGKYGVHVCLNFHRAPGYTVASPPEQRDLWTDDEAQRVCALHWATFARRYRGIPNSRLSFNLFNEPPEIAPDQYVTVVRRIIEAIRREDPDRLIICDGLRWGQRPALDLAPLKVAQATRGYVPSDVTHYRASWVHGGMDFPLPQWPRPSAHGTLYNPGKAEVADECRRPLTIEGPFATATRLRLRVHIVSSRAKLVVRGNGQTLAEWDYQCGPGEGPWKEARLVEPWNVYQNLYDQDVTVEIPEGTNRVEVAVTEGDWLRLSEIGLRVPGRSEDVLWLRPAWGRAPAKMHYMPGVRPVPFQGLPMEDRDWLWKEYVLPWKEAQRRGIGVMVGEFGCFHRTPHDVVLRWMEDCLKNWQQAGWGWALWNLRGSFGIVDSGRSDVDYESFEGHQLDRRMLELLQRY